MKKPKVNYAVMIRFAAAWLAGGLLPSELPARLEQEFGLSVERPREVASAALLQRDLSGDDEKEPKRPE